ncbi:MAG: protein kinase [Deltaproteobacteria bacterium]|nr:protein kinase [Deltaproteobacteria bacterium]
MLRVVDADTTWKQHVAGAPEFAFYVAEKCKGSLEKYKAELGDVRRRLEIFRQACEGVAYLHSLPDPVFHRDIKPDNFLITEEHHSIVLADFGIARAKSDPTLTQVFEVVGTPYYRAPETHHGQAGTVEADIYGLGRVLEWLLTGDVSTDMGTRSVPRGLELDDAACDAFDRIITKATHMKPAQRYASVQALLDQLPDLVIALREKPKAAPTIQDTSAATVLPAALALARAGDRLGWRQLENLLRRDYAKRTTEWRAEHERGWRDRDKQLAFDVTDALLDKVMGRVVFALAGVFSNDAAFTDQRRTISELVSIQDWNRSGIPALTRAPYTVGYVFHYCHGALCMAYDQPKLALQLGNAEILNPDTLKPAPVCKNHDLKGWPRLFGPNYTWSFEYLKRAWERFPVLQELFALRTDFEEGLAAYSMLMCLDELAADAATATPATWEKGEGFRLDFPPMFMAMDNEIVVRADRRVFGDRELVAEVALRRGAKVDVMKKLWPNRQNLFGKFYLDVFDRFGYVDLRLGELA